MAGKGAPLLPKAGGGEVPLENEFRKSLSFLDVLCANEFEGEQIDPAVALKTQSDFYTGAPPTWMNFYLDDKTETATAKGEAVYHIKREGYNRLRERINFQLERGWSVNTTKLLHQPGSGGSTLAMQVLWDLRKKLRCAVLIDPSCDEMVQKDPLLETKTIAKQVIELFKEGGPQNQNTVLLLQDNVPMRHSLQDCIIREIAEQNISADYPVVIILQCKRTIFHSNDNDSVTLSCKLTVREKGYFAAKEKKMRVHHGDKIECFHSFDILRHNFNAECVRGKWISQKGKEITQYLKQNKSARNTKLFAFIALISSYVPGSYLSQSVCESFHNHLPGNDLSFEEIIQPFSHLLITFPKQGGKEKCVRMAHPLLAHQCVELLAYAGVKRSIAALDFLQYLCRRQIKPSLLQFFKELLTKRETTSEGQEKFSRLILDIEVNEGIPDCVNVLKTASETFKHDPFFPQSLARFYYARMYDFVRAEHWAVKAKERVPTNSFIADTLGQVHKNHLNRNVKKMGARDILFLAEKAINAFKQEEELAEKEVKNMLDENSTKVFNNRGLFGYLQVAKNVYDSLTNLNLKWKKILTHEIPSEQLHAVFEDRKLLKYKSLITSLKNEVQKKMHRFFESYLTYSDPINSEDEPPYFRAEIMDCYVKYTSSSSQKHVRPLQILNEKMASTFPGLLSILNQKTKQPNLGEITELWKKVHQEKPADVKSACNYILANIIQSNGAEGRSEVTSLTELRSILQIFLNTEMEKSCSPEFYLLVLLLFWPDETQGLDIVNLNVYIAPMKEAFETKYKKYLQSRDLVPLFYLGRGAGLKRFIHKSKVDHIRERLKTRSPCKEDGQRDGGDILKVKAIQDLLICVQGVARGYKTFACVNDQEIEVCPHKLASVWKDGLISFYLGFNISGPMAFDIKYRTVQLLKPRVLLHADSHETYTVGVCKRCETCDHLKGSEHWTEVHPLVFTEAGFRIHWHRNPGGRYECKASGLRWVCKSEVLLKYHFSNWEPYCASLQALDYIQGGPLLDISVTLGELEEIHLPHFACIGSDPSLKSSMRILHVEDSGLSLEEVHEVTCCHAKLLHPTFSPKGVLVRSGFPLKVHCDLMVYLSGPYLRTYLLPSDLSLVKAVEKQEKEEPCSKKILVPRPEHSLKMQSWFRLESKFPVDPEKIKLRYSNTTPSFFSIDLTNLNDDLMMKLMQGKEPVWSTNIRKAKLQDLFTCEESKAVYQARPPLLLQEGFVKKHFAKLVQRTKNVLQIADNMLSANLIGYEQWSKVNAEKVPQDKARELLDAVMLKGPRAEDIFLKALYEHNPGLIEDLVDKD